MDERRTNTAYIVAGVFLLLPVVYVVGYFSLMERQECNACAIVGFEPRYRVAHETSKVVFWPMHYVDQQCRPDYWADYIVTPPPVGFRLRLVEKLAVARKNGRKLTDEEFRQLARQVRIELSAGQTDGSSPR